MKPQPNALSSSRAVLSMAQPLRIAGAAADLPDKVLILKWGENIGRTTEALIIVDDSTVKTLSANQELVACDRVPMDYEHQSVPGHPNYKADPRLSPGSGKIEVVPGEGVYLSAITYTGNGQEMADSYQDVSAVVHLSKDGHPLWISSVALTQLGDVAGLEFSQSVAALSARRKSIPQTNMKPPVSTSGSDDQSTEATYRTALLHILGLPAETSEEALAAAISEELEGDDDTGTQQAALSAKVTAFIQKAKTGKTTQPAATPAAPAADNSAALSARLDNMERRDLVSQATREGKVIPLSADEIAQTPIAILSAMIKNLPAGEIPLSADGTRREKPTEGSGTVALSATDKTVAKSLGLSDEEYAAGKVGSDAAGHVRPPKKETK